jgi:hypothetical protein
MTLMAESCRTLMLDFNIIFKLYYFYSHRRKKTLQTIKPCYVKCVNCDLWKITIILSPPQSEYTFKQDPWVTHKHIKE